MKLFVSYRRDDSAGVAGRLFDRLQAHFGRDAVFMDVDSIPYGIDFREHLSNAVGKCDALLAVIGDRWTSVRQGDAPRLHDPSDFVRIEIKAALARGIPVIPLLVGKTPMPREDELPPPLRPLAFRNACGLDIGPDFHVHVDRLIRGLEKLTPGAALSGAAPSGSAHPQNKQRRRFAKPAVVGALLFLLAGLAIGVGYWKGLGPFQKKAEAEKDDADEARKPLYGPVSGRIVWKASDNIPDAHEKAGVTLRDCVIEATYFNPLLPGSVETCWTGITFRWADGKAWCIGVDAEEVWSGGGSDRNEIAFMNGFALKMPEGIMSVKRAAKNHLKVVLEANQAKFYVNSRFVGDVNVEFLAPGDVALSISPYNKSGAKFAPDARVEVFFEDFRVYALSKAERGNP